MEITPSAKIANPFECLKCDYQCKKESDYKKHLATKKHINKADVVAAPANASATLALAPASATLAKDLKCSRCDKVYKTSSGLWKHTKLCSYVPPEKNKLYKKEDIIADLLKENIDFKNIILDLVKGNTDLQKQILEVSKKINLK